MQQYRRVTRACAERDWKPARTHDDVLAGNPGDHLLDRFLHDESLDYCHEGRNPMDRSRGDLAGAGPHKIGNFHIKHPAARRAWLWRDTGELDPAGKLFKIDWMIATGARRKGDRTDLQDSHSDLLRDSDDTWLPTEDDYADLADAIDARWLERAFEAVHAAVEAAEAHRRTPVTVDIDKVNADVVQDEGLPIEASATVIEEYSERWFIVERLDAANRPVQEEIANALAAAAFEDVEDDDDIEEVSALTTLLGGTYTIDPGRVYAWRAIV